MRKGGLYLALGDSVTWTQVTKGDDLYSNRIKNAISKEYSPIKLINKGIGGINSSQLVDGLIWNSRLCPDLVTIGIGMNDSSNQAVPVGQYKTNVEITIDTLRLRNPNVHIILCTPNTTTDANRTPYIESYRTAMVEVSASKNVDVVHFESAWNTTESATYTVEGIHPNSLGHGKLFEILYPIVKTGNWLNQLG
jgi:lysophospholipase L1-like esterase